MNHPYQVLGTTIPKMLGRERLVQQIERHLLKPSPDHVSIVGPARYGKSVLLHHLALKHQRGSSHYVTSAYTDLRHAPPTTDAEFRRRVAEVVKKALAEVKPDIAGFIEFDDAGVHELLDLAFQELDQDEKRLLVVLDGFDHVLAGTGLTRNLWDQLRSLAQKRSLRLVTGSRRPLRELCKTDESRTSDFWEIFYDTPVSVGAFEDGDWDSLLAPLVEGGMIVNGSGRKELVNWSGGVPVLAAALLERLADGIVLPTLTKTEVDREAQTILDERRPLLDALWDDCGVELRGDLAVLAESESDGVPFNELPDGRRRVLEGRGFAKTAGNRLWSSCRLIARFAAQQAPAVAELRRLFGTSKSFEANARSLLELRFAQVAAAGIDKDLRGYVESAIRDLEPNPEFSLKWVRSIANRALAIIWDAELGPEQKLPEAWLNEWKGAGERLLWLDANQRLPRRQGAQCNVLRLATGADNIRPLAKFATKPTALLVDVLQSIGDFGQHRDDFPESKISSGYAAVVVLTAIELVDSLRRDLTRPNRSGL